MISVHVFGLITSKDESKKNIKLKNILILILFAILHTIAYLYLKGTYKTVILCTIYAIYFYIVFDKKVYKSIFSSIIYAVITIVPDLLTLGFATKILGISKVYFYDNLAGGVISNIVINFLMIILIYLLRKPLKTVVNYKLSNNVTKITINVIITNK